MIPKIEVKNATVLRNIMSYTFDPVLVSIICYIGEKYGACITEGWRAPRHPGDVHSTVPVRAVDLRHWIYESGVAEIIKRDINSRWQYDPNRPHMRCAIIHDAGRGLHFHIQVHPHTRRRGNGA